MRGSHETKFNLIPLEVEEDIRDSIENYPSRESHYSDSVRTGRKYLGSDKNISSLYREFIEKYQEYDNYIKYGFFRYIFKDCNVGFGPPRADISCTCGALDIKIQEYKKFNKTEDLNIIENQLKEHQNEANYFYKLQNECKNLVKSDVNSQIFCVDYEKNFYLPVTNVGIEYYSRQLSLHNFCIHNMKNDNAFMFMYSENFAKKGPNETISFIQHYVQEFIETSTEELYILSDNSFAQNKSRYIWLFYKCLVVDNF
jgi:hypothetical protein